MIGDAINTQIVNLELVSILRSKLTSDQSLLRDQLSAITKNLSLVDGSFSLSHLAHEIVKLIKNLVGHSEDTSVEVEKMVDILAQRFAVSFRPQSRDILDIFKLIRSTGRYGYFGAAVKLLNLSFSNQLGNPKGSFQGIASDCIPLLCSPLPVSLLENHSNLIHQLISHMFVSRANMICLSGLLRGSDVSSTESDPKRRKVSNYVETLFDSLEAHKPPPQVYVAVLAEYIARIRRTSDSLEEAGRADGPVSEDEFLFFKRLLSTSTDLDLKCQLWQEMSRLHIYRLRDESALEQKELLGRFLSEDIPSTSNPEDQWRGLSVVLTVDAISFSDQVTIIVMNKIFNASGEVSEPGYRMIQQLFRSFATKGLLHELMKRIVDEILENKCPPVAQFSRILSSLESVSSFDLMECYHLLFATIKRSDLPDSVTRELMHVITPLVGINGTLRLNENTFSAAIEIFDQFLTCCLVFPKSVRSDLSVLILAIADGLRNIKFSRQIPNVTDGSMGCEDPLEAALNFVAAKDSRHRTEALLRLATVFGVDVDKDELSKSKRFDTVVGSCTNQLDEIMLKVKFGIDTKPVEELGEIKQTRMSEISCDMDSLLIKSGELLVKFPRIVFTPPSLRQADFPTEVVAIETVWSNMADDKAAVSRLVEMVKENTDNLVAIYGLTVVVEEKKRMKKSSDEIAAVELAKIPILARTRMLLALPPTRQLGEELLSVAHDLMFDGTQNPSRDRAGVDCAYYALFHALNVGRDSRKIRAPWWASRMHVVVLTVRGLIGACISGDCDSTRIASANYVVRIWKLVTDSVVTQLLYRVSKSLVLMIGEYIRLSHKMENPECAEILDRGCCILLSKLNKEEREHCHALLGRADRESLKRINEIYEKTFRYTGKV